MGLFNKGHDPKKAGNLFLAKTAEFVVSLAMTSARKNLRDGKSDKQRNDGKERNDARREF